MDTKLLRTIQVLEDLVQNYAHVTKNSQGSLLTYQWQVEFLSYGYGGRESEV